MPSIDPNSYNLPLDIFYSALRSNTRYSGITDDFQVNKEFLYNENEYIKQISYNNSNNYFDRKYKTDQIEIETNIHLVDSTLFKIEKIQSKEIKAKNSLKPIEFNIGISLNDEEKNFITTILENNKIELINFGKSKIHIEKNIEFGLDISGSPLSDTQNQLIKIKNNSSKNLKIGTTSDPDAIIKIDCTGTVSLTGNNRKSLTYEEETYKINYDIFEGTNSLISPSSEISNIWLIGNEKYWEIDPDLLTALGSKVEYLSKPRPKFKEINIGNNYITSNISSESYYNNADPFNYGEKDSIGNYIENSEGKVRIANSEIQHNFSYYFDTNTGASPYHLCSGKEENGNFIKISDGEIDYLSGKYTIKYPTGYKEILNNNEQGYAEADTGGLLNLIKKGTKIHFKEDPNATNIVVRPVSYENGQIKEAIVEANEFIFD